MKKLWISAACCLTIGCAMTAPAAAQEFANIEYLCCDWGPAMKLSGKTNEPPVFSETDEEIYFLKQVGRFTRKKRLVPDLLSGSKTEDIGHGTSIYLCKMKPDGSEKMEIKELWRNPPYPIDTQGPSCWLNIHAASRRIALAIKYAGSDLTGLWTVSLDGRDLKRIIKPGQIEGRRQAIDHPSWTPNGQWIVYEDGLRGTRPRRARIARCDSVGGERTYLTDGPEDRQPVVSPDGNRIAYIHWVGWASLLWVMDVDGKNAHQLADERGKPHGGTWSTWSPDGKKILLGESVIDTANGRKLIEHRPILQGNPHLGTTGWPQWGRSGIVGFCVGGILFTDPELKEARWMGSSKLVECTGNKNIGWW